MFFLFRQSLMLHDTWWLYVCCAGEAGIMAPAITHLSLLYCNALLSVVLHWFSVATERQHCGVCVSVICCNQSLVSVVSVVLWSVIVWTHYCTGHWVDNEWHHYCWAMFCTGSQDTMHHGNGAQPHVDCTVLDSRLTDDISHVTVVVLQE